MRLPSAGVRAVASALLVAAAAAPARAQLLTFEDLCYSDLQRCGTAASSILWPGGPILPQYASFTWTNFRALDLDNYPLHRPDPDPSAVGQSGYPFDPSTYGTVLGLSFGNMTIRRPTQGGFGAFQFNNLLMGSGWTSGMTLAVSGSYAGQTVFTQALTLSAQQTSLVDLPDVWVDQLVFSPNFTPPGYSDPYDSSRQNNGVPFMAYWFDNVAYSVTPEPATFALVGGGLLAVGLTTLRRRRR